MLNRFKRTIQRIRKIEICTLPEPNTLNYLKILDEYTKTTSDEIFLQYYRVNYDGYYDRL
jgi:hypothetical protein